MARPLTRDDILNYDDLKREKVLVPEWGGNYVYVRSLTGAERDRYESLFVSVQDGNFKIRPSLDRVRATLVALTVVDKDGNRLFSDEDVELLGKKNAAALNRLFDVATRLSGITEADVEELVKNSD